MKPLIHHLLGEARAAILAALLLRPDQQKHVRELARMTGSSPGALHRELTMLVEYGVLLREQIGRQVFYRANPACPVLEELTGLMRKTAGLVDVLRDALETLTDRIAVAFVYGSMASGTESGHSDIDIMVIGDLSLGDAVRALAPAQNVLKRDVNPTVMKQDAFRRKRDAGDAFVTQLWNAPILWVIGSKDELGQPRKDRIT